MKKSCIILLIFVFFGMFFAGCEKSGDPQPPVTTPPKTGAPATEVPPTQPPATTPPSTDTKPSPGFADNNFPVTGLTQVEKNFLTLGYQPGSLEVGKTYKTKFGKMVLSKEWTGIDAYNYDVVLGDNKFTWYITLVVHGKNKTLVIVK